MLKFNPGELQIVGENLKVLFTTDGETLEEFRETEKNLHGGMSELGLVDCQNDLIGL